MNGPTRQTTSFVLITCALALGAASLRSQSRTPRPLGTFTLGPEETTNCQSGFTCNKFVVACPNIPVDATGVIAVQKPTVPAKGMIMFFSGSTGTGWWQMKSTLVPPFFQSLLDSGYELVQVTWNMSWLQSPPNVQAGQKLLACRIATVIKWTHANWYVPLGLQRQTGRCGFCLTGSSSGGAAIGYALASYDIGSLVDAAVPTSAPPMASIDKGCLQKTGYAYPLEPQRIIDLSYGYRYAVTGPGPCELHDASWTQTWINDSVETGGTSYNYPTTRIHIIVGGQDNVIIHNHANDYFRVLKAAHQPMLTWQQVPRMAHQITQSQDGLDALFAALTQGKRGKPIAH
jgi:hypothetical protein